MDEPQVVYVQNEGFLHQAGRGCCGCIVVVIIGFLGLVLIGWVNGGM